VRVGGTSPVAIDVRVITATNINLEKAIMNKTFREDLYYRLNRLPIYIPALKERIGDLPEIIDYLIQKINQDYRKDVKSIDAHAIAYLKDYHWPGNVRELENIVGRAMIYIGMSEEVIKKEHIPELMPSADSSQRLKWGTEKNKTLQNAMEAYEKQYISEVLQAFNNNKTQTAKHLNISIRNLYYKLEKYKIEKNNMQKYS